MDVQKKKFCLVGFGNHAKNKLLPSLEKEGHKILGIVSTKKLKLKYKIFNNLEMALKNLSFDTYFLISSPPKEHFRQIKEALNAKRNIYVEKPIFTDFKEVKYVYEELKNNNILIVELLMYKYTKLYEKFIKVWEKKKNQCVSINCYFNIPYISKETFRDSIEITSSPLYDIGCYILSLLVDLGISLKNLKITEINTKNKKIKNVLIKGYCKKIQIYAEFGVGKEYKNLVNLEFGKDYKYSFEKFFYGVEAEKRILVEKRNVVKEIVFKDQNGFENIFKYSKSFWLKNQNNRFVNIMKVNQKLSTFKKEINLRKF